ncbi:GntR family transcriptional regulator [uncultured Microbacterium sp.]|uniref:GntR family transcriptional regulator n=1 Tax=uncultured Microbacterium sp. TaxID=191216 RepID=UPI0035CC55E7
MSSETAFAPLDPRGTILGDEVFTVLGNAILDGSLQPGERLRDVDIAARMGVSRTPVREAIQRLERIGLVEVAANRYTRVSVADDQKRADTHEFVVHLMGGALRMALPRCTDEELAAAVELADVTVTASLADDLAGVIESSAAFLQAIGLATGNTMLRIVMEQAEMVIRRDLAGWQPYIKDRDERSAAYVRLRDAVAARDGILAETMLLTLHGFS